MRIFVTGATGWVGSAVVQDLVAHGHQVLALARSPEKGAALAGTGITTLIGTIQQQDLLARAARESDGVIHCAFNHDFTNYQQNADDDKNAIAAIGAALQGTDKPFLSTGGMLLTPGRVVTEEDEMGEDARKFPRVSEPATLALAARGVRASVVRLPPSVHGKGDHGFVPHLVKLARETGVAAYIGDGANRWPAVHVRDAAAVYRLALGQRAGGAKYHPVGDDGIAFRRIAETIGRGLGVPAKSLSPEEAQAHFGWFALFAGMDIPASGAATQKLLGVTPQQPGLLDDMQAHYFS